MNSTRTATLHSGLPQIEELSIRSGPVGDHLHELFPEERTLIAPAQVKRQWEFATGRKLARSAMTDLELSPGSVGRGEQREPIWPAGMIGSITHTDSHAMAAVARSESFAGLGIDMESPQRVEPRLYDKLFSATEQTRFEAADPRLPGLLFAAKEAGYKATWPIAGRFIGFQEAEVDVAWSERRFRLRYVGDFEPNRIMESARGYFAFHGHYVLSLVIIPRHR